MEELEKRTQPSTVPSTKSLGWRHVETLLLLMGITIAVSLRVCFSVAIVAMRNSTTSGSSFKQYDWDHSTATYMLHSFSWGYTVTHFPAGYLARISSAKNILTLGVLSSALVNMLTPCLADIGYKAVIASRVVMGLCQGCIYTCTITLISRWIPPLERARLGSAVLNGMPLGTIIGMSFSGLLAGSRLGWPSVFYFFGVLGIIWSLLFYWLGADYPSDHSKISSKELEYIKCSLKNLKDAAENKSMHIPWKMMIKSLPLWAVFSVRIGNTWGLYMFLAKLPSYLNSALQYDISQSGTVSALPYVAMWLLGFPISFVSDYALKKGAPTAYVRKTCATIGFWIPALCMLILGTVTTTNKTFVVCMFVVAIGFNSATTCSTQINYMELAPNYVSLISCFSGGLGNFFSSGIPFFITSVITDEKDVEQWQIVFFVTAAVYFFSNLIFLIFGKCEVQAWNNPENHVKNSTTT